MRSRHVAARRQSPNQIRTPITYDVGADHRPKIGGLDVLDLARTYGTPLYIMDAATIRSIAGAYRETIAQEYGGEFLILYASKANLSMGLCKLMEQEGLGLDVVSGGELYTAIQAGFPVENILFNGNNKTSEELEMVIHYNVGRISVDNFYELELINEIASKKKRKVSILLRITPGIECHTHDYIKTGQTDTKFGFDLSQLSRAIDTVVTQYGETIDLKGLHAHIGSQIFEIQPYEDLVQIMLNICFNVRQAYDGLTFSELNLGGGLGIQYTKEDDPPRIQNAVSRIINRVKFYAEQIRYPLPKLYIEPGRSMVATSGVTLYSVGSMKVIPRVKKFVAINGGMGDNIRPSLYQAKYSAVLANKLNMPPDETVTVVGKYCESGDVLIPQIVLPKVESGDTLMVFGTGAYNYSMASNYNRIPRPPVVLVENGKAHLIVKRETYETVIQQDLIPAYLMESKAALLEAEEKELALATAKKEASEKESLEKNSPEKNTKDTNNSRQVLPALDDTALPAPIGPDSSETTAEALPVEEERRNKKDRRSSFDRRQKEADIDTSALKTAEPQTLDEIDALQAAEWEAEAPKEKPAKNKTTEKSSAKISEAPALPPNIAPIPLSQLDQIDPDAYLDALDYQMQQQR
ncbi:MAG: diaminopimelate decarboxylase [Vampirovibrionales bacterium]|nr:diaminopimelate decarboxylase [Vampirovibrionales bacterium]